MKRDSHLLLLEADLAPAEEWSLPAPGWLFVRICNGDGYWLGSETRPLKAGDVMVLPHGEPGLIRASQLNKVTLHYFLFYPELLTGFFTLAEQNCFGVLATQGKRSARHLAGCHPAAKEFAALVGSRHDRSALWHRCRMLDIVSCAFQEEINQARLRARNRPTARHRFLKLVNEMPAGELVNHTHDQLAQLCRCGRRQFNRLFQDCLGVSFRHLQSELRVAKAMQKLHQTTATMPFPGVDTKSESANQWTNAQAAKEKPAVKPGF